MAMGAATVARAKRESRASRRAGVNMTTSVVKLHTGATTSDAPGFFMIASQPFL